MCAPDWDFSGLEWQWAAESHKISLVVLKGIKESQEAENQNGHAQTAGNLFRAWRRLVELPYIQSTDFKLGVEVRSVSLSWKELRSYWGSHQRTEQRTSIKRRSHSDGDGHSFEGEWEKIITSNQNFMLWCQMGMARLMEVVWPVACSIHYEYFRTSMCPPPKEPLSCQDLSTRHFPL